MAKTKVLEESFIGKHKEALTSFFQNVPSRKQLSAGTLGGLMFLSNFVFTAIPHPSSLKNEEEIVATLDKNAFLIADLYKALPHEVKPLRTEEEERVTAILSMRFGFPVRSELENIRLNRNYGLIGAEQHLARFPGDSIETHFENEEDAIQFAKPGMAPGLGAYRYFAPSNEGLSEIEKAREKWYIAVPTFLSPGFAQNSQKYYEFFKWRKMLVVNPQNGRAVVSVVGDAGPSEWTGKHLGGSPEVMRYLERVDGSTKGPVLYFLIDDPHDKISLGPVHVL